MIDGIVLCILLFEGLSDIRYRSVSGIRILVFGVLGILINIFWCYQTLWSIVGGVVVGLILLVYAFFTRGAVGIGDGIMFVCLGIYLGTSRNIKLLFLSLVVAAVVGIVMVIVKKKSIKSQIPFVPCILLAYTAMLIMEVIA